MNKVIRKAKQRYGAIPPPKDTAHSAVITISDMTYLSNRVYRGSV